MGISVTSPIVINMPTRERLAGDTKDSSAQHFEHLSNKNNVCRQTSSLYGDAGQDGLFIVVYVT